MLYDKRWDRKVETKADPFSLAGLIAWLETQPAGGTYDFACNKGGCLIAKYGEDIGINWRACHTSFAVRRELKIASREPHTFGTALDRARKLAGAK